MSEAPLQPTPRLPANPLLASGAAPAKGRRLNFAPAWLQVVLIVGLFGSAVFVILLERYLWGALLAVAGLAFGLSFVLRRMVGDEYGRT